MPKRHLFAEQTAPRYTSYPTAPHFHAGIGTETYARWLSEVPANGRLSLYIHVPFCTSLCAYCGCHTELARRKDPLQRYVELIHREIDLVGARLAARSITHIHWGGGTPSILGEPALVDIVEHLRACFELGGVREHAIELDPRHVSSRLAETLVRIGANRASLGVQEFSPHVQAEIGRVQPFAAVKRAVGRLRASGIENLNFDLMYGLPRQTTDDVRRSVELAVSLGPQRVALFGYAHVPWFRPRQRLISAAYLPGAAERFEQMDAARRALCDRGYEPIGFDHFATPEDELAVAARTGRLRRNFQGYTTDTASTLVGLGASSIGRLPQGFVQNVSNVSDYARRIETDELATTRGVALTDDDRVRASVIESLMCQLRAELAGTCAETQVIAQALETLRPLETEGWVRLDDGQVIVTEAGRPFVRLVAAAFDVYLTNGQTRHSTAV
jgi:oxygen-independent coproporphyrinogen III oxidase